MRLEDAAHNAINLFVFQNVGIKKSITAKTVQRFFYQIIMVRLNNWLTAKRLSILWYIIFVLNAKNCLSCLEDHNQKFLNHSRTIAPIATDLYTVGSLNIQVIHYFWHFWQTEFFAWAKLRFSLLLLRCWGKRFKRQWDRNTWPTRPPDIPHRPAWPGSCLLVWVFGKAAACQFRRAWWGTLRLVWSGIWWGTYWDSLEFFT